MSPETVATNLYLGRIVATARQRKGWNKHDLADAAGLGSFIIMGVETGRAVLTPDRQQAIERALDLRPGALDAPGFMLLTLDERSLVLQAREARRSCDALEALKNGKPRTRARLLGGRLGVGTVEAAPC